MSLSQSNPKTFRYHYPITVLTKINTRTRTNWGVLTGFEEVYGNLKAQLTVDEPNKPFKRLTAGRSLKKGLCEAIFEARGFFDPAGNPLFLTDLNI